VQSIGASVDAEGAFAAPTWPARVRVLGLPAEACVLGIAMLEHPVAGSAVAGAAAERVAAKIPAEMIGAAKIARMVRVRVMIPPVFLVSQPFGL
jgi:hypothetical protein